VRNDVNGLQISLTDRITAVEAKLADRFVEMDHATKVFDDWKLRIKATIDDICLEMGAMRKTFQRVVLDGDPATSAGVFHRVGATTASSPAGNPVVGPIGHRVEHNHRESGIQSPLPVKGTLPSSSIHPLPLFEHRDGKDTGHLHTATTANHRTFESLEEENVTAPPQHWDRERHGHNPLGRLPKIDFPKFTGANPKLWLSRCEDHFEMYFVEQSMWVRVARGHMSEASELWL
jgi:hypothetical protein